MNRRLSSRLFLLKTKFLNGKDNKNVKFIFIEQFTECDLKLDISIKTNDILWIKFYSGHKNTGVHYLDTVDDTIMKIVYTGLSN